MDGRGGKIGEKSYENVSKPSNQSKPKYSHNQRPQVTAQSTRWRHCKQGAHLKPVRRRQNKHGKDWGEQAPQVSWRENLDVGVSGTPTDESRQMVHLNDLKMYKNVFVIIQSKYFLENATLNNVIYTSPLISKKLAYLLLDLNLMVQLFSVDTLNALKIGMQNRRKRTEFIILVWIGLAGGGGEWTAQPIQTVILEM